MRHYIRLMIDSWIMGMIIAVPVTLALFLVRWVIEVVG